MDTDGFMAKNPLFTREDWMSFRKAHAEASASSAEQLLKYYVGKQRLLKVRKELYAVVPPGAAGHADVDPFVVCMKAAEDAVVSYHAALEFHGQAYSLHQEFQFMTGSYQPPFYFQDLKFRPVLAPKLLREKSAWRMETLKRERGANVVVVTSMERTLVDCLDRPELAGGWEELWRSLVSAAFYDLDKVVAYAGRLENATTAAKVGFFLEQNQQALRVPETVLDKLATLRPKQKHYIGPGRAPGKYLPRWNLIVPPPILEQAWGAVL